MFEAVTGPIDADELLLAQLACAKLAGMVQGALSIGLPALSTCVPEPRSFLEERFRVMTGFALVLDSISGKPGNQQEIQQIRGKSRQVLANLEELQQRLLEYLDAAEPSARAIVPARQAAAALCDGLAAYGDLAGLERSRISRVKAVVLQVFDAVEHWSGLGAPATA